MGNCIRKGSAAEWGGEDWGSFGSGDKTRNGEKSGVGSSGKMQKSSLLAGEGKDVTSITASDEVTEVKVKISKKQLETLLKKADVEGLSTEQVLAQLMNVADQFEAHRRSWKPALKSIPE